MLIPINTDLRLGRTPYIVYIIIGICFAVYCFQFSNQMAVAGGALHYCEQAVSDDSAPLDIIAADSGNCLRLLITLHEHPNPDRAYAWLRNEFSADPSYDAAQIDKIIAAIKNHYLAFQSEAEPSLTKNLVHPSSSFNPLTMISAAFAHGDWLHIIFNMIFFLAFAAALENLIDNKAYFIALVLVLIFVTSATDTMVSVINGSDHYSLGFSGVVCGMIGLAAFFMPKARIRCITLYWRQILIPAWLLAVWFIGWDIYHLFNGGRPGIGLVAHVSGGLAGYMIGRWRFAERKKEIEAELSDEIEYMQARRETQGMGSGYVGRQDLHLARIRQEQSEKEWAEFKDKLHGMITRNNDSQAMVLILQQYEGWLPSMEIFTELHQQIGQWNKGRAWLCFSRLLINLWIDRQSFEAALNICQACMKADREFTLSDPLQVMMLAKKAQLSGRYGLGFGIIHKAKQRYCDGIYEQDCLRLEQQLLNQLRSPVKT